MAWHVFGVNLSPYKDKQSEIFTFALSLISKALAGLSSLPTVTATCDMNQHESHFMCVPKEFKKASPELPHPWSD